MQKSFPVQVCAQRSVGFKNSGNGVCCFLMFSKLRLLFIDTHTQDGVPQMSDPCCEWTTVLQTLLPQHGDLNKLKIGQ